MRGLWARLAVLGSVLPVATAVADYSPPSFYQFAGTADQVVIGTITAVHQETFELQVEQALIGPMPAQPLRVRRFRDWTCSIRWKPYAVGQKELAFLTRVPPEDRKAGEEFQLMSAGSEGEWEILGNSVLVPTWWAEGYPEEKLPGRGEAILPLADVVDAIPGYAGCFTVKGWEVEQKCSDAALAEFRARSPFHEELAASSLKTIQVRPMNKGRP